MKGRIIMDFRNLFELKNEDYCKPVRVRNFLGENYIEYERSNSDWHKTLQIEEYERNRDWYKALLIEENFDKIRSY